MCDNKFKNNNKKGESEKGTGHEPMGPTPKTFHQPILKI